jgi:hypothetical protein
VHGVGVYRRCDQPADAYPLHRHRVDVWIFRSDDEDLDLIFSWREQRKLTSNLTLHYERKLYLLPDTPINRRYASFPSFIDDFDLVESLPLVYEIGSSPRRGEQSDDSKAQRVEMFGKNTGDLPTATGQFEFLGY